MPSEKRIALISTGGTIEKTYDPLSGVLVNELSVLDVMLASFEMHQTVITRVPLMNKDSSRMVDEDHDRIAKTAHAMAQAHDGVIVVHGTDRLQHTGDAIVKLGKPEVPVVLTGAMRPYIMRNTDAVQNLIEALCAARLADPGVYAAFHGRLLTFPGVVKDFERGRFVYKDELLKEKA